MSLNQKRKSTAALASGIGPYMTLAPRTESYDTQIAQLHLRDKLNDARRILSSCFSSSVPERFPLYFNLASATVAKTFKSCTC